MVQQAVQKQPVAKPAATPSQPMAQDGQVEKKSRWWLWLIIALVVIGAGIGIYFIFF